MEYARFADDIVILIDAYPQHDWLLVAVGKRLREELALLHVTLNEAKSRIVDLAKGGSFGFLGFDFRRVRTHSGKWRAHYAPQMKKRTALLRRLKAIFRRYQSQPIDRVIDLINPILRGWVTYFAIGDSGRCFGYVQDWVEKKIRRHLMRARKRKGFGWKRWSRRWLYDTLGLYGHYRVHRPKQLRESAPSLIGCINLGMKRAGVRSAGNPHAAYDVAGVGNGVRGRTEAPANGESCR
jgi:RNA-directed DNA polymerase